MDEVLSNDTAVDAVVAVNDATAIGAARLCKERGIRIPEDIAMTGYDDIQWAEYHDPPLTTVRAHPYQMGRLALRRVINLIDETNDEARVRVRIRVQAQPIYRASSG
jgi:DNA-binding LacI/PurR family transcriptional regulator